MFFHEALHGITGQGDKNLQAVFGYQTSDPSSVITKAAPTAIVASNDAIAGGAIQALEDKGWSGRVLVSGQDADLAAIERIFDGSQLMTVYKPVGKEARTAAEAAMKLARHEDMESRRGGAERHADHKSNPTDTDLCHSGKRETDRAQRWISEAGNRQARPAYRQASATGQTIAKRTVVNRNLLLSVLLVASGLRILQDFAGICRWRGAISLAGLGCTVTLNQ